MAYDKIVDSAKLDADLTMVADAIREGIDSTEKIPFPNWYAEKIRSAAQAIVDKFVSKTITHIYSEIEYPNGNYLLSNQIGLVSVDLPYLHQTNAGAFERCESLVDVNIPSVRKLGNDCFSRCTALQKLVLTETTTAFAQNCFWNCTALNTLVLKANQVVSLENVNCFDRTPFASGGTGGTVYVPSALIAQYQTATNWSTLYAAGTCNFVAIEGSEYE